MTIGENIKRLREERQMSQSDLARAAGYKDRSSISRIEVGDNDPTQKSLARIAKALNVSPSSLFDYQSETDAVANFTTGGKDAEDIALSKQIVSIISEMSQTDKVFAIEILKRFAGK